MSNDDRIERMQTVMDKISDKLDKVFEVVSDIKANERFVEHRFTEHEEKHKELHEEINELKKHSQENYALKKDVESLQNDRRWLVRIVVGAVCTALVGLVVYTSPAIKQNNIISKKPEPQRTNGS